MCEMENWCRARVVYPLIKGHRSEEVYVRGPAEELSRCERVLARFTSGIMVCGR